MKFNKVLLLFIMCALLLLSCDGTSGLIGDDLGSGESFKAVRTTEKIVIDLSNGVTITGTLDGRAAAIAGAFGIYQQWEDAQLAAALKAKAKALAKMVKLTGSKVLIHQHGQDSEYIFPTNPLNPN